MKVTEAEIKAAHGVADRLKADLEEARKRPGCEALAALLEERLKPMAETLTFGGQRKEMLHNAHVALTEAKAEYQRTQEVPCSLDRETALRRRDDIEHAMNILIVREREVAEARAADDNPLLPVTRYQQDPHRAKAAEVARSMAEQALRNDGPVTQPDPAKTPDEQALWETFFFARELEAYAARKPFALRFADDAGVARAVAHLQKVFDKRVKERTSRLADNEVKAAVRKERAASERAESHGIAAMEKRAAEAADVVESFKKTDSELQFRPA